MVLCTDCALTAGFCSRCPPRTFLPALCKIFLDESAPDNVLEVTARAITYYLDVSAECTRRIVGVDGAIKALCNRLVVVELNNRTSRDLAEQCVKVREQDLTSHDLYPARARADADAACSSYFCSVLRCDGTSLISSSDSSCLFLFQ